MDNPYQSPVAPRPAADANVVGRRRALWKSLLLAYAVHHVFSWLGLLFGLLVVPGTGSQLVFPSNEPRFVLAKLLFLPIVSDLRTLAEPLFLDVAPPALRAFRLVRFVIALTILAAGIGYLRSRRSLWLWYLGAASFVVGWGAMFYTVAIEW